MSLDRHPLRVRISNIPDNPSLARLTPGARLQWGPCQFVLNPASPGDWDFWIVWGSAWPHETGRVAPQNTLFVATEPPSKKVYPRRFYQQFGHVVDSHNGSHHPGLVMDALGLNWLVGYDSRTNAYTLGYDQLRELPRPAHQQNAVSVVCSNTAKKPGQRRRLHFLAALKERLGERLVHFGRGFRPVTDKLEAILPYRCSLVLENSCSPHYWTEKLADAYLGWSFPFYFGAPNLAQYFAAESFEFVDDTDVDQAARVILARLATPPSATELAAVARARQAILEQYNPFARFAYWVERFYQAAPQQLVTIRSAKAFRPGRGLAYRWQHRHKGH